MEGLIKVAYLARRVVVVVAVSSGEGANANHVFMPLFMQLYHYGKKIEFLPYSDEEMESYIEHHLKGKFQFNELKEITGNNPYLLTCIKNLRKQ